MKIALAQINPTIGAFSTNGRKISEALDGAKQRGADLVIFPEMVISGYPPKDLLEKKNFVDKSWAVLEEIASQCRDITAVIGAIEPDPPHLYNIGAVLSGGAVQGVQRKSLLPTYDVFDERRYFHSGHSRPLFTIGDKRVGILICEDAWYGSPEVPVHRYNSDPLSRLIGQNPDLLIHISASPYSMGKIKKRNQLFQKIVSVHGIPLVSVNQVGGQDDILFDGTSIVYDSQGKVIARGHSFREDLVLCDLTTGRGEIRPPVELVEEEVFQALVMGTRDYTEKCGFSKGLVGLSGGIDSSLVAAVACRALGGENVMGVTMPFTFSSPGSVEDSRQLAENLNFQFENISIEPIYDAFTEKLAPIFGDLPFGVAEENLQARIRGQILMSISNKLGHLVYATGNKSELSVGYCTLHGDMSGGLSVISDVPKTLVYKICHHLNRDREVIPRSVIEKPPSAELRPDQKDSDSLPDYEILDRILQMYVEGHRSPQEIVDETGIDREVVRDVVRKVDLNEYKRQMAAPGLRITTRAFGFGWRMPIAQGFHREMF